MDVAADRVVTGRASIGARFAAAETSGFDYLRLSLSLIVIMWHSSGIVLAGNGHAPDPFILFVRLAVPLFFALSGFLVASSLERTDNLRIFLTNRLLRIFPALTIEIVLSALVLGPLLTTFTLEAYFRDPEFRTYFLNVIGVIHYHLPGVFKSHPPTEVNRSLWTVPFEFECYVMLALLYVAGLFRYTAAMIAALVAVTAFCFWSYTDYNYEIGPGVPGRLVVAYFLAGNVIFKLRDRLPGGGWIAWGLVALSYLMLTNVTTTMFSPLVVAYAAAALGCTAPRRLPIVFTGDYSYGLYLYAMPIQQTIIAVFGPMSFVVHYIASVAVSSLFAAFSWHYIEKPALRLKRHFLKPKAIVRPQEVG